MVEKRVFDILDFKYVLSSNETILHADIDFFSGSPDATTHNAVCDVKSPNSLKSFCELIDCWDLGGIEEIRNEYDYGEKYYWQIVANSILTNKNLGELIVYVPYKSELNEIRELCQQMPENELYKYFWIANSNDEELPYLLEGGYYKNLNILRFEIPELHKIQLLERIKKCGSLLIDRL